MALTATATPDVLIELKQLLGGDPICEISTVNKDNITYHVHEIKPQGSLHTTYIVVITYRKKTNCYSISTAELQFTLSFCRWSGQIHQPSLTSDSVPDWLQGHCVCGLCARCFTTSHQSSSEWPQQLLLPWWQDVSPWQNDGFRELDEGWSTSDGVYQCFWHGHHPARRGQGHQNWCTTQPWAVCARVWVSGERWSPVWRDYFLPWKWFAACQVLMWRREPWSTTPNPDWLPSIMEVHDNYM